MKTQLLETLKFVGAALSTDNLFPSLHHFLISGGSVTASNNSVSISAPFPVELNCSPQGKALIAALEQCTEEDQLFLTQNNQALSVRSGNFRAIIPCQDNERFPQVAPALGEALPLTEPLLDVFEKLLPFVSTDNYRPWACGLYMHGNTITATNNLVLIQHDLNIPFPLPANLPIEAAKELIRSKLNPVTLTASPEQITFGLYGEAWITCKTLVHDWPDVRRIFGKCDIGEHIGLFGEKPLSELREAAKRLKRFIEPESGVVYFTDGFISASPDLSTGASVEIDCPVPPSAYNYTSLCKVLDVATTIGFPTTENQAIFSAPNIRGIISRSRT